MRTLADAQKAWKTLEKFQDLSQLRESVQIQHGDTSATTGLRSVCWKSFLLFESFDQTIWPGILGDSRTAYDSLRNHFLRAIEHPDELESAVDPLSDNEQSPWTALRQDEALREEIFRDVERCMPENTYFRQPSTQKMLLDILFIYCKLNPDVGYRQGMHELLAPILWVVERDAVDLSDARISHAENEAGDSVLKDMFNAVFIEHDTFTLFGLVMQNAKSFYEQPSAPSKPASTADISSQPESPILRRIRRIFEHYLLKADPGLASHLKEIDIQPQIFLMRWMRLLFGREFPFDHVLGIWDMTFAEDPSLKLVDYICLAMVLRIRWDLVQADSNEALTMLLRYPVPPPSHHPQSFVEDAVFLQTNLNNDGGAQIIAKHSGRRPPLINQISDRPNTPRSSSDLPFGLRSPLGTPSRSGPPMGLEGLLQDAARGVYSRGEKWGFNKAVRNAMGEVKKNVQDLQAGRHSPRFLSSSESGSLHRRGISGDIIKRIEVLEGRNKALGKMLEGAVAELWDFQKERIEDNKGQNDEKEKKAVETLSVAIAKVQFVQVYLEDASLPLSVEDIPGQENTSETMPDIDDAKKAPATQSEVLFEASDPSAISSTKTTLPARTPPVPESSSHSSARILSAPSKTRKPTIFKSKPKDLPTPPPPQIIAAPTTTASPDIPPPSPVSSSALAAATAGLPKRPPIAQSSFSWMLGQDPGESSTENVDNGSGSSENHFSTATMHAGNTAPPSMFVKASPFVAEKPPAERLKERRMGFLFGDEEEVEGGGAGGGGNGKDKGKEKGKRGRKDREKKDATGFLVEEEEGEEIGMGELRRD
ncbi:RabGAP/TBC [Aulographum hederae CBS 113979]|uniref:RabGAP/TBC n=1 Tax=Aulographum hederae CBS 113979 TaxID=1176131 RepID=A0A6G1H0G3_9PEZI|nr:RabGAP/TBC [Aulographum hederae CBS 113979]